MIKIREVREFGKNMDERETVLVEPKESVK